MTLDQAKTEVSDAAKKMEDYESFHITAEFKDQKGVTRWVSAIKKEGHPSAVSWYPQCDYDTIKVVLETPGEPVKILTN